MNNAQPDRYLVLVLRLGAFLCLAGWTWVHFYWQGPYGILLWREATYALATKWGVSWEEFVGSGAADGLVQKWNARVAWLYLAGTVLTLTVRRKSWLQMTALLGGSGLLTILSYAKYLAAESQLPMFVEHGGQMLMPLLLVMALALGARHRVTVATAIVAFIMTFAGHGSYALGLWPTPAQYHGMIAVIFRVEYASTKVILPIVGALDFIVCLGILVPRLRRPCALYAAAWGFLTALARPVAGMSFGLNYWGADQYLQEAVIRAPHFLIPVFLFFHWHQPRPADTPSPVSLPRPADAPGLPPIARPSP